MEPAFQRGDLLFLWNRSPRTEVGEIVVYNVRGKDIPIVHRVVRTFPEVEANTNKVKEITVYVHTRVGSSIERQLPLAWFAY